MTVQRIVVVTRTYSLINPAATRRRLHALSAELFAPATSEPAPTVNARARKARILR